MSIYIITDKDKLKIESNDINMKEEAQSIKQLIVDLKETLRETETGTGLSAIQIGVEKRIFVINFDGDLRTFINPMIDKASGLVPSVETCLSLPGKKYLVPRYQEILVLYQTPLRKIESVKLRGYAAFIFQHHYDHLVGVTLDDIGLEFTKEMEELTEDELTTLVSEVSSQVVSQEKKGDRALDE